VTVYQPKTPQELLKVAELVGQYPQSGMNALYSDPEKIAQYMDQHPHAYLFSCEDERGRVRAVLRAEARGAHPREPKIAVNAALWLDPEDLRRGRLRYAKEILSYAYRYAWEVLSLPWGEFLVRGPYLDIVKAVEPEVVRVVEERDTGHPVTGKAFLIYVDFKRFVELHG